MREERGRETYLGEVMDLRTERSTLNFSLRRKFLLVIGIVVIPVLGAMFVWIGFQQEREVMNQIIHQARILAKQVVLTRQWISDCGGVLVDEKSKGAQGTVYFFENKVEIGGKVYRRFCPAMVTKKLSQYALREALYRFHLTSLDLLNPENAPGPFEEESLKRFEREGLKEIFKVEKTRSGKYFQYMIPLILKESCLRCHTRKGYKVGMIRGGLSVFLPIHHIDASLKKRYFQLFIAALALIFLTVLTLYTLVNRLVVRPVRRLERMAREIGNGNLSARVDIRTGDEFEILGRTFNAMAENLSQSHEHLQEKVEQATRELMKAYQELQTLDKLKSDFLSNMSHELRTPLTAIRGGVDFLKRTIEDRDKQEYLKIIDKNLSRLTYLVTELFDFSKIEAGKMEWHFSRENISALVQDVIDMTRPLADEKGIVMRYDNPGDIYIEMDLERIEQVLVNLLDNAIKFSDAGKEIRLRVEENERGVVVSVKDQGIGIPPDKREEVFKKFYTYATAAKGGKSGTGLGLAICKGIIEGHGGQIWVESELGKGSTFYFFLPKQRENKGKAFVP